MMRGGVNAVDELQFLARDVIYTSCAYAMMSVSFCLSVCLGGSALAHSAL